MLISLKILLLAILFVMTGGSFFGKYFDNHNFIVSLAVLVSILGSVYLGKDICEDLGYCEEETFPFVSETNSEQVSASDKAWEPTNTLPLPPL